MIQNIKVDLIYHATASDFEMEFNLNGICRMRLLTDKTEDKKTFLSSLSRAVGRSKVIITCGPLFGNDGLIKTIATAIGKPIVNTDNQTFGINSDDEIGIISGSVPLVTSDGIFGGCIIECGPQTIIMLTDSKSVKKALLKELIHPYIRELSMLPEPPVPTATETEEPQAEVEEPTEENAENEETEVIEENEEAKETSEEIFEEKAEETEIIEAEESVKETEAEEAAKIEETEENVEIKESEETYSEEFFTGQEEEEEEEEETEEVPFFNIGMEGMHLECQSPRRDTKSYYEYFVPGSEEDIFIPEDEEFDNQKPTGNKLNAPLIIITVLLILMLAVIGYFLVFIPLSSGQSVSEYMNELFSVSENMLV